MEIHVNTLCLPMCYFEISYVSMLGNEHNASYMWPTESCRRCKYTKLLVLQGERVGNFAKVWGGTFFIKGNRAHAADWLVGSVG